MEKRTFGLLIVFSLFSIIIFSGCVGEEKSQVEKTQIPELTEWEMKAKWSNAYSDSFNPSYWGFKTLSTFQQEYKNVFDYDAVTKTLGGEYVDIAKGLQHVWAAGDTFDVSDYSALISNLVLEGMGEFSILKKDPITGEPKYGSSTSVYEDFRNIAKDYEMKQNPSTEELYNLLKKLNYFKSLEGKYSNRFGYKVSDTPLDSAIAFIEKELGEQEVIETPTPIEFPPIKIESLEKEEPEIEEKPEVKEEVKKEVSCAEPTPYYIDNKKVGEFHTPVKIEDGWIEIDDVNECYDSGNLLDVVLKEKESFYNQDFEGFMDTWSKSYLKKMKGEFGEAEGRISKRDPDSIWVKNFYDLTKQDKLLKFKITGYEEREVKGYDEYIVLKESIKVLYVPENKILSGRIRQAFSKINGKFKVVGGNPMTWVD